MSVTQHDQFSKRLKRINAGQTVSWTVPGEGLATRKQEMRIATGARLKPVKGKSGGSPIVFLPLAVLTGMASIVAGRWLTATYLTEDGPLGVDIQTVLGGFLGDIGVGLVLSLFLVLIFNLTTTLRAGAHMAAFAAVMLYEHELVHLAPDLYASFYPAAWVSEKLAIASVLPI